MYKRRKKLVPAASSTLIDNVSKGGSFTSSQSSIISAVASQSREDSPEDIFTSSPEKENLNVSSLSFPLTNPKPKVTNSNSGLSEKSAKQDVLDMLVSSEESEPLPKIAKKNYGGDEKQALSQRVLSQRVRPNPLKLFYDMLSSCGLILGNNGEANILKKSHSVFVRNLTRVLQKDSKETSTTDKFIESLNQYLSETEVLKAALSPTKNHPDVTLPGDSQESFIRLLLLVEVIQGKVISFLLDKVAEYAFAGEESNSDESLAMMRMILYSMRYLTNVSDPENLTKKLFDIIHSISNSMMKHEIINCLPDIISDSQQEETANELIELLKREPHLSPSILYTLSNLWLDSDPLYLLQMTLIRTLRKTALDQIPAFVRFILMRDIDEHADEIINGLRSELILCHADATNLQFKQSAKSDVSSTIFLIFEKLRDSVLKSKKLADQWLKNISKVKTASQHKPIDILMLVILHTITPDPLRKKSVESVFRNKIKIGHFKETLIKDTLSVGIVVIKEYFSGLLKLLSSLLHSPDITVSNFSAAFYVECFRELERQWKKLIILELKGNVASSKGNVKPALNLIHSLTTSFVSEVAPYVTIIMLLLDRVGEMKIDEVRQLMDILCMIAFSDSASIDNSSVQDELSIIAHKQLYKPDPSIFRSGIISCIIMIKHMVTLKDSSANETPSSEEEIHLNPMSKKAFNLFETVLICSKSNSEALVLTFDQLSLITMNSDNLDKCFMKKLSLYLQSQLQSYFIIASSEYLSKENGLESTLQFCIDTDFEDPIVLNLVDAVVLEENASQVHIPLVALPGLVRVIRSLEIDDLSEIDALLGCALSLPSPSIYSKFGSLDPHVQRLALDCLFHACNWLREMLNSFVFLIKENSPNKILKRLRLLFYFQNLISICLPQAYSYSPPKCYFDCNSSKQSSQTDKVIKVPTTKKKQRKNAKKDEKADKGEDENEETAVESDEDKDDELISVEFSKFIQYFREFDFDVCLVLTQPLIITPQAIQSNECSAELGQNELVLILDDLNSKLNHCIRNKKSFPGRKEPPGFENLSMVSIDLIIKNTSKLSHHLIGHLQKIVEYLHNLIATHDGILDATGMFCPGSQEIKQCMGLIFSIFNTYLSWPDLESEEYFKYMMKCLIKLGGANIESKKEVSRNGAIKAALTYLNDLSKYILDLTSAIALITLMKTLLYSQDDEDKYNLNLGELCEQFLQKKWYDSKGIEAKGALVNKQLSVLLNLYLSESGQSLDNIQNVFSWLTIEVESLGADGNLTTFPHFNKSNLNILIHTISKGLLAGAKENLEGKDYKEQLNTWEIIMNDLQNLIGIIKIHDSRINLRQFLKGSLPILRYFLVHGMTVCSSMFKIESLAVSQTIKKLQVITRYIQSVCNYSKVNNDNSLIKQLPGMRGTLETILLSVKNMVLQNKCTGAFFMGSMRHKDIHGEIISTQETEEKGDSEELQPTTSGLVEGAETSTNESGASSDDNDSMSDTC